VSIRLVALASLIVRMARNGGFYIYTVFVLVYATQVVGLPRQAVLNGVLAAYMIGVAVVTIVAVLMASETRHRRL
jgi:hypothetical protein